jgi:hypothetical protein
VSAHSNRWCGCATRIAQIAIHLSSFRRRGDRSLEAKTVQAAHRGCAPRQERSRWGTNCAHVFPKPSTSVGTDVEAITRMRDYAGLIARCTPKSTRRPAAFKTKRAARLTGCRAKGDMLDLGDEARPEPRTTLMASTGSAHTKGRDCDQ